MGTTTDYKEKYLKSFFKWQAIYENACQREKKLEEKLKIATNTIEQVLKEPQMMDAGMLMFLTVQLNKIKG